ncbi:MAG: tryptophan synthase subunit alpha [Nitrospinae bacterium]|nr:tryptophan synthase subunit alpha [Nitrospinota bacterium]
MIETSRISEKFAALKAEKKKGLIIFVTAGDPDLGTTERLVPELFKAGADVVELGIPFSDPLADGPVIQQSFKRALDNGATLGRILDSTRRIREHSDGPIVFMSAYNLAFHFGLPKFAKMAVLCGVDGVIFPDLIPEEAEESNSALKAIGLDTIFLVAPTTSPARTKMIASNCGGFVYYVSVSGVTGGQKPLVEEVKGRVAMIKRNTDLPVAVGFGISTPEQVGVMGKHADGVIVGSAVVKAMEGLSPARAIESAVGLVRSLRTALDK